MKQIESEWLIYEALVLPQDASPIQIRETRKAFYAGAKCLFELFMHHLSSQGGQREEEKDLQMISGIDEELNWFNEDVKKGIR